MTALPGARVLAVALIAVLAGCGQARKLDDSAAGVPGASLCGSCHGAPPATGAHLLHAGGVDPGLLAYGATGLAEEQAVEPERYAFGCGHCHPVDVALHMNSQVNVVLAPEPGAGGLKALSPAAASYDRTTRTCSNVYCHSSGQASPAFVASPAWDAAPGTLGCGGCHGNPPRYPSGEAGAADANAHLQLWQPDPGFGEAWEWGHFGGLPGVNHDRSKHGGPGQWAGDGSSPITCQTCHAGTVAPTAVGPSGLYFLDTTGDYALEGGLLAYRCADCHVEGGVAPAGRGAARPLRHVNGRRDVVFDARTELPPGPVPGLPAGADRPSRPYWVTSPLPGFVVPSPTVPDLTLDGTTMSLHLGSATYDPATKTCTSVACHAQQTEVRWGAPFSFDACAACHGF